MAPTLGQCSSGWVSITPGDATKEMRRDTPSPAEVEAGRIRKAQDAMIRFITDLNALIGKDTTVPPDVVGEDADALTREIYHAVQEAGIDYKAEMKGEESFKWVKDASRVVAKLRRDVPESAHLRVLGVRTGTEEDAKKDPDVVLALERADIYFKDHASQEAIVDLATCLLDYAFTRQGLDDELARIAQPERVPDEIFEKVKKQSFHDNEGELFVEHVKWALLSWKISLGPEVRKLSSESIYRIASVHAGLPTGDPLARRCYEGALDHKGRHATPIITIGHAALGLEALRAKEEPRVHYPLETAFCRICGNALGSRRHGCCMTEAIQQSKELQQLPIEASFFYPGDQRTTKEDGYLFRQTLLEDGTYEYEVHVKDVWASGVWQAVKSPESGARLAKRIIAEHQKAQALVVREPAHTGVDVPPMASREQTLASFKQNLEELLDREKETLREMIEEVRPQEEAKEELDKLKAHYQLGRSLKWLSAIICLGGFLWTGKVVFVAVFFATWLMGHTLMDKKKIALKEKERKALKEAENDSVRH